MAQKERNALGAGLSVLFGDDSIDEIGELSTLPISKIEPRKEQPRTYFDEDAIKTLAESIEKYGLIQPIAVRKLDSGYYQIIAGERRWRASKMAKLSDVPVRILDVDDQTTAELALVENLQRENLNPIEEAKGYKALMEEYNLTQDQVATAVGKGRTTITNSIRLLMLSPNVINLVEKGELATGHAKVLISISDADEQLKYAKEAIEKNLSVRKLESLISTTGKNKENAKKENINSELINYIKEINDCLSLKLGRKVRLTDNGKSGKIEIEFYGSEDREKLIEILKNIQGE